MTTDSKKQFKDDGKTPRCEVIFSSQRPFLLGGGWQPGRVFQCKNAAKYHDNRFCGVHRYNDTPSKDHPEAHQKKWAEQERKAKLVELVKELPDSEITALLRRYEEVRRYKEA